MNSHKAKTAGNKHVVQYWGSLLHLSLWFDHGGTGCLFEKPGTTNFSGKQDNDVVNNKK